MLQLCSILFFFLFGPGTIAEFCMASLFFIFNTKVHNHFAQATNKHKKQKEEEKQMHHVNNTIMTPGKNKNKQNSKTIPNVNTI